MLIFPLLRTERLVLRKLKPEDFGKKKLELNLNTNSNNNKIQLDGMHSPRNVFNSELEEGK